MYRVHGLITITLLVLCSQASPSVARTLYGFTAFPYDLSQAAVDRTYEIVLTNSSIFPLHFDN